MSAGGDGKILIWRLSHSSKNLKLVSGFVVQTDSIPRNLRVSKAKGDSLVGGKYKLSMWAEFDSFKTQL